MKDTEEMRQVLFKLCDAFEVDVILKTLGDVLESVENWKDKAYPVYKAMTILFETRMENEASQWKSS